MDNYVKHYNDHYLREGESGSGQLEWKPQYQMWLKAGYKLGMSVLDYGCGVGIMVECGIKPDDYTGVDISEEAIRLALNRYPGYNFMTFKTGRLIPIPSKVCVAQSVFTHTPKAYVPRCLQDIKRNFTKLAVIDVFIGEDNPLDDHVRYFTEDEWLDYLWKEELHGERIGNHNFVGYEHIYYKITHRNNR